MDRLDMPPEVSEAMQKFFSPEFDVRLDQIERYINTLNLIKDGIRKIDLGNLLESLLRMTEDGCPSGNLEQAFENNEVIKSLPPSQAESLLDMMKRFKSEHGHPLRALPVRRQEMRLQPLKSGAEKKFRNIGDQPTTALKSAPAWTSVTTGADGCKAKWVPHHVKQMNSIPKIPDTGQESGQPSVPLPEQLHRSAHGLAYPNSDPVHNVSECNMGEPPPKQLSSRHLDVNGNSTNHQSKVSENEHSPYLIIPKVQTKSGKIQCHGDSGISKIDTASHFITGMNEGVKQMEGKDESMMKMNVQNSSPVSNSSRESGEPERELSSAGNPNKIQQSAGISYWRRGVLLKDAGPNCIVVGVRAVKRDIFILPKPCEASTTAPAKHGGETGVDGSSEKNGDETEVERGNGKKSRPAKRGRIDVSALCGGTRKGKATKKKGKKRKKTRRKRRQTDERKRAFVGPERQDVEAKLESELNVDRSQKEAGLKTIDLLADRGGANDLGLSQTPSQLPVCGPEEMKNSKDNVNAGGYDEDNLSDILIVDEELNLPKTKTAFMGDIHDHAVPSTTHARDPHLSSHASTGRKIGKAVVGQRSSTCMEEGEVQTHMIDDDDDSCSCWKEEDEDCLSMSAEKEGIGDIQCSFEDTSSAPLAMSGMEDPAVLWKLYSDLQDSTSTSGGMGLPMSTSGADLVRNVTVSENQEGRVNGSCTNELHLTSQVDMPRLNCENCYPQCEIRDVTTAPNLHARPLIGSHIMVSREPEHSMRNVNPDILEQDISSISSPTHGMSLSSDSTSENFEDQVKVRGGSPGEITHDVEANMVDVVATVLPSKVKTSDIGNCVQNVEVGNVDKVHKESGKFMPSLEPSVLGATHGTDATTPAAGSDSHEPGCHYAGRNSFLFRLLTSHNSSDSDDTEDGESTIEFPRGKLPVAKKPKARRSRRNRRSKEV